MTKDDEGPLGAALSRLDRMFKERELGGGLWSIDQLHALVLATMHRDAGLVCVLCKDCNPPELEHGEWRHNGFQCDAGPIRDQIAQMEKART